MIEIFWEIERMDDNQEIGAADGECLLDIDGDIHCDGPEFRKRGLGREVIRETLRHLADDRVGAVLIDINPIQHRPGGYDDFFDEVRDLPFNAPETDQARLIQHFKNWGMVRVEGADFMVTAPSSLCKTRNQPWYPGLLED